MNTGKQYTFWQLISSENDDTAVLIPRIQRDYIQYRDGKVKTNLKRFTNNLIYSLVDGKRSINLNFIYGNSTTKHLIDSSFVDAFSPIDGQQRLTTLFLLHFYVFNKANSPLKEALKNRFFYDTRSTTQKFLDKLLEKGIEFCDDDLPSKIIRDSGWYSSLWDFDPSVLSCLEVLDQIHKTFIEHTQKGPSKSLDWKGLVNKLTHTDACPIKFMKLDIEGIDKPNELYIKMNSRGKQLTAFENFKTELYGYLNGNSSDLSNFKQNMDGSWLEFLWDLCQKLGEDICEKYTDSFYRELLHWIILNRVCCLNGADNINDTLKSILESDNPETFYLSDYISALNNDKDFDFVLQDIYYTMNLLSQLDDKTKESITCKLFDLRYEKKFTSSINQYMQRALLFAVTKYAIDTKTERETNEFSSWWRVANNLITNSQIDSLSTYFDAIKGINEFEHTADIETFLCNLKDDLTDDYISLPSLNSMQCTEEVIKQKIISECSIPEWKDTICKAEQHKYFNGEIFFVLKLAGVSTSSDATKENLETFNDNWEKISCIFGDSRNDIDIHRALLVFGDYSKTMSDYDEDYFKSYYFNDTKHHNNDWRGMLRDENGLKIFEEMLEEFKSYTKDFSTFTNKKCKEIKSPTDVKCQPYKQELHYYLIKEPYLFKYIHSFGRCWFLNDHIRLLRTATRGCFISYQLYVVYTKLSAEYDTLEIKCQEGKGYEGSKNYECDMLKIKTDNYYYKPNEGFYLNNSFFANSIDDMIKEIKIKYSL